MIPEGREGLRGGNTNESKQQEQVSREDILTDSLGLMERLEKRKQLDINFKGEVGTGLGPTYEFFTLLAECIQNAKDAKGNKLWIVSSDDGCLFPSPVDAKSLTE